MKFELDTRYYNTIILRLNDEEKSDPETAVSDFSYAVSEFVAEFIFEMKKTGDFSVNELKAELIQCIEHNIGLIKESDFHSDDEDDESSSGIYDKMVGFYEDWLEEHNYDEDELISEMEDKSPDIKCFSNEKDGKMEIYVVSSSGKKLFAVGSFPYRSGLDEDTVRTSLFIFKLAATVLFDRAFGSSGNILRSRDVSLYDDYIGFRKNYLKRH